MGRFKNRLCLELIPELDFTYESGLAYRLRRCQRHSGHPPPHRTRLYEWNDGDRESRRRTDTKVAEGGDDA
jgi:hypothetical protein